MFDQAGKEIGIEAVINNYDKYRRFSFWAILIAFLAALVLFEWWWAAVLFALLHIHALLNQIWWKLKNIEREIDTD